MVHWLVLPSPFLGAPAYAWLVEALRAGAGGDGASVAPSMERPDAAALVDVWSVVAAGLDEVVLLPHSNAGHLAPLVSDRCGGLPIVFVDAALPATAGTSPLAPDGLLGELRELAEADGLLPRWSRWWPREELDAVLPGDLHDRVEAILPRIALDYVEGRVAVPTDWENGPCAYLAFGSDTYSEELARARRSGWPVAVLPDARHLHVLVDPTATAAAIRALSASGPAGSPVAPSPGGRVRRRRPAAS